MMPLTKRMGQIPRLSRTIQPRILPQYQFRFNSTKTESESEKKSSSSNTPPPNRNGILLALGALALGTTVYSMFYTKGNPQSAIEPQDNRSFKDGEISVVYVLGGPGSGKGTQCGKLVNEKGFVHLSAGDLLRAEQARKGSKYGELIASYIKEGKIVPQEVTIALLEQAIKESLPAGKTKFLIDGFPRKMDQALTFENTVAHSLFTLFFECPESVMLERLLERGKTSGRTDDNIESIKKRFATFIETSMPVVSHFDKQGKVVKVRCDQPVEEVYSKVLNALKDKGI